MSRQLRVLTNSAAVCYRTCPRKYFIRNEIQVVSKADKPALTFGTSAHGWIGAWLETGRGSVETTGDPYSDAKLHAMLKAYDLRWSDWRKTAEVVDVEKLFCVPLVNPDTGAASTFWELAGKFDALIRDGRDLLIEEHKTSVDSIDPGSGYIEKLRLDSQVSSYLLAEPAAAGMLYDVLRKPQLRPLMATPEEDRKYTKKTGELYANQRLEDETPDEFYARCLEAIAADPDQYFLHLKVVRLEQETIDCARDLWFTAAQIRESIGSGRFPRNPSACYNYNSFCEYWPICTGQCGPDDPRFEFKKANSELSI